MPDHLLRITPATDEANGSVSSNKRSWGMSKQMMIELRDALTSVLETGEPFQNYVEPERPRFLGKAPKPQPKTRSFEDLMGDL